MIKRCTVLVTLFKTKVIPKCKRFIEASFEPKYLVYTNTITSMACFAGGDWLEQRGASLMGERKKYDYLRTWQMTELGFVNGVLQHYWYELLDYKIKGNSLGKISYKIFLDQVIGAPVYVAMIFIVLGFLEGKSYDEVLTEIKVKGWDVYVANLIVWPAAQFINFYFLPPQYRVLYINFVTLLFDVYLSFVTSPHSEEDKKE